ncbi:hypothetical protein Dtox_2894 [Desulfofarcimen acetoxidans DSM 771]|uniref:Nucleotidyltransferase family protein n=1 Tax=Desulfofarcimen acetoxidans (strain ATCC 49208 / DSM 771 / KCTC 5769 / VKM B-1644 / 5575) TaxID=485916 RepID=C8W2H3_DESAS|nr:nucleotidyltransferase family protein [Desulfofarcimen acetoxidans]ACV63657.1 hypothetical protein Dtox_2894 [Desulfofarcimen acetoxidans DSM 771]
MQSIQLESYYLIHLLSALLKDTQPQNPPYKLDWEKLYKFAAWHGVSNMACYGLNRLTCDNQPPQDILEKFENDRKKAVAREATQHIAVEQILEAFEEKGIVSMPLKGCLLKYLYPRPDMRMMADIDIYFKTEQAEKVKEIMPEHGYTAKHQGGNHDVYYRKPYMNIEMHHRLISEDSPYSDYLKKTWDRVLLKSGCRHTYELSHEDFFIYLVIHLTKHYANGGTGIRSFLDIWVYKERYKAEMDWDYIQAELNEINFLEFAENIFGLCEVWFGNAGSNVLYDGMTEYVSCSGVYGIRKHAVVSSMGIKSGKQHSVRMAKWLYSLKLFFPPFDTMKIQYPFLERVPKLLPVCWVLRGLRCIVFKRGYTLQMINNIHNLSEQDMRKIGRLHEKAGLLKQ